MLPTIGPGFVWLSKLRIDIEMLKPYRRPTEAALGGAPPAGVNTPRVGRGAPLPGPVLGIVDPSPLPPNSITLVTRTLTVVVPGPRPKLRPSVG